MRGGQYNITLSDSVDISSAAITNYSDLTLADGKKRNYEPGST